MRKLLALLLSLFVATSLLGCRPDTPQPTETDTTTQTQTEELTVDAPILQMPMVAVSLPVTTETVKSDDGTDVFYYCHQNMSLVLPEPEIADKVIVDYLNRIDSARSSVESMHQNALVNYSEGQDYIPYLYSITYSPMRIDQGVLSMAGTCITYSGGAHPDSSCTAANYDLTTGEVLTLGSILHHIDAKDVLQTLVLEALDKIADEAYLYEDYQGTVKSRFLRDESYDEDWYFSDNGLCFYFSPYEIAPYASGTIVAEVPYESLVGVIADAYFPPEIQSTTGTLTETPFEGADLAAYTQIAELIFQKESSKTLYYTEGSVQNLKISYNSPITGRTVVVFATQSLTPGDAVMVEAPDEIKASLHISYSGS